MRCRQFFEVGVEVRVTRYYQKGSTVSCTVLWDIIITEVQILLRSTTSYRSTVIGVLILSREYYVLLQYGTTQYQKVIQVQARSTTSTGSFKGTLEECQALFDWVPFHLGGADTEGEIGKSIR